MAITLDEEKVQAVETRINDWDQGKKTVTCARMRADKIYCMRMKKILSIVRDKQQNG